MVEERIRIESIGIKIEGLFENRDNEKGVVIAHPHPIYGGDMYNSVVEAITQSLKIWNPKARLKMIDGADHFYGDKIEELKFLFKQFY